jgi:hypothetical protein
LPIFTIKEIRVLANHTFARNTPEGRALRQAFKCSALIIAVVAVLFYTGAPHVKQNASETSASARENSSSANTIDPAYKYQKPLESAKDTKVSSPNEAAGDLARQTAFQQNKPVGSVFADSNPQSKTAQVSSQRQSPPMDSHRLARLQQ